MRRFSAWTALPTLAALAALAAISGVALAEPPDDLDRGRFGPGERDPGFRIERMAERLDLTDDQANALEQAFASHRAIVEPQRDALRDAREALHAVLTADDLDEPAIREASAAVAAIEADLAVGRARLHQELRSILTAEQLEEWSSMRERLARRGPRDRHHRGPHRRHR